jgi:GGDEF domain-containing protein
MKKLMESDLPPEERVSIAYGMSVYEGPSESIDDCIKRADILMYEIKKQMKLQQKK